MQNFMTALTAIKDPQVAQSKTIINVLEGVVSWSSLLKEARSDPDELPFLHSLAMAICLANNEEALSRSPKISRKSLIDFYEAVDQNANKDWLPYLKPLTDRIDGFTGLGEDNDSLEEPPSQVTLNVDELRDMARGDESVQAVISKILKSPAVSRKRKATRQVEGPRIVPGPIIPSPTALAADVQTNSRAEELMQAAERMARENTNQATQDRLGVLQVPFSQGNQSQLMGHQPPLPSQTQHQGHPGPQILPGATQPSFVPVGAGPQQPWGYSVPLQPTYTNYSQAPQPYQYSPTDQWGWGVLPLIHDKKPSDQTYSRTVSASPATTMVVGDSRTEIQVYLPRNFTDEGLVNGPKPKNHLPQSVGEYTVASSRIAEAMKLQLYPMAFVDHANYVNHMVELESKFTWDSIMKLDEVMRRHQVLNLARFLPPPYEIGSKYLVPRLASSQKALPMEGPQEKGGKKFERPCTAWNRSTCSYDPCKFRHVCLMCEGGHRIPNCPKVLSPQINSTGVSGGRNN
jgi:hypothetical protein